MSASSVIFACRNGLFAACLAFFAIGPLAAQVGPEEAADLYLILMVDVSGSVNRHELLVQREGYIAAFRHPALWNAVEYGAEGAIAVAYVEWAGPDEQRLVLPFTRIDSPEAAQDFASALAASPMLDGNGTSISGALRYAAALFATLPDTGARRVIDLSADGVNNGGPQIARHRDALVAAGVTINGLPIALDNGSSDRFPLYDRPILELYFEQCVVGGVDSFVMTVTDSARIGVTILRKLIREIAAMTPPSVHWPAEAYAPQIDCARAWGLMALKHRPYAARSSPKVS